MRFSKPLPSSRDNGRLSGSAQTRSSRASAAVATQNKPMTSNALRKAEHIKHASLLRRAGQVFHRIDEPRRSAAVPRVEVARDYSACPPAHARQHRDVLAAIGAAIRNRLADNSRACLVFPQLGSISRIDSLEPAVHGSVESDVAAGDKRAAPYGEVLRNRPFFLARDRIPGGECVAPACWIGVR